MSGAFVISGYGKAIFNGPMEERRGGKEGRQWDLETELVPSLINLFHKYLSILCQALGVQ